MKKLREADSSFHSLVKTLLFIFVAERMFIELLRRLYVVYRDLQSFLLFVFVFRLFTVIYKERFYLFVVNVSAEDVCRGRCH